MKQNVEGAYNEIKHLYKLSRSFPLPCWSQCTHAVWLACCLLEENIVPRCLVGCDYYFSQLAILSCQSWILHMFNISLLHAEDHMDVAHVRINNVQVAIYSTLQLSQQALPSSFGRWHASGLGWTDSMCNSTCHWVHDGWKTIYDKQYPNVTFLMMRN